MYVEEYFVKVEENDLVVEVVVMELLAQAEKV